MVRGEEFYMQPGQGTRGCSVEDEGQSAHRRSDTLRRYDAHPITERQPREHI